MTTYVLLANWTEQGIRDIKDSPQRLDTAKKMLQDMGGSIKSFFLTMGDFDIVAIYEAPDDAIASRFVIKPGQLGALRTQIGRAPGRASVCQYVLISGDAVILKKKM